LSLSTSVMPFSLQCYTGMAKRTPSIVLVIVAHLRIMCARDPSTNGPAKFSAVPAANCDADCRSDNGAADGATECRFRQIAGCLLCVGRGYDSACPSRGSLLTTHLSVAGVLVGVLVTLLLLRACRNKQVNACVNRARQLRPVT
jgi:hypothetical protein